MKCDFTENILQHENCYGPDCKSFVMSNLCPRAHVHHRYTNYFFDHDDFFVRA